MSTRAEIFLQKCKFVESMRSRRREKSANLEVIMYSERAPGRMGEFSWTKSLLLTRENTKHCSSEIDPRLQHNYRTNILGHKSIEG